MFGTVQGAISSVNHEAGRLTWIYQSSKFINQQY